MGFIETIKQFVHKGIKIRITRRPEGLGGTDYGYSRSDGTWGVGFRTKRGAEPGR